MTIATMLAPVSKPCYNGRRSSLLLFTVLCSRPQRPARCRIGFDYYDTRIGDIDVLVEFDPDHIPGLLGIARMERELSALFGGRKVDLRTPEDLSRYFRQRVLAEAEVQYARG